MVAPVAQAQFARLPQPLRQAAQEFEATFLAQILQPMFQGLATDGPFGGGQTESVFRGFLIDEIARSMARAGGVGVAPAIGAELLKLQEGGR